MRADSQSRNARQNRWLFPVVFIAVIVAVLVIFNIISKGLFPLS